MKKLLATAFALILLLTLTAVPLMADDAEDTPTTVPPTPTESSGNSLTPNVIVTKYSYGDSAVPAGQNFSLTFTLYNTNKNVPIHNVMVKVSGGESFALRNEADTFHITKINAAGTASHTTALTSSVLLEEGSYPVSIIVSFEYYDGGVKMQGASELNLAIPVVQNGRIKINRVAINATEIWPQESYAVSYAFINNGFGKLLNTEVAVVDKDSGEKIAAAYLGTVEPSTEMTGSSNLTVSFEETGVKNLQFVVSYEDAKLNNQTVTEDFTAEVTEYVEPIYEEIPGEEVGGGFSLLVLVIVILVVVAGAVVTVVIVRKRRAKAKEAELLEDDDEDF